MVQVFLFIISSMSKLIMNWIHPIPFNKTLKKPIFFSYYISNLSSRRYRWPSQALPEWGARLPGRRSTRWPFHWYHWHPATKVCHAPTQPQPIWGGARAAVGPTRAEGEKGEGQPTGTRDRKEGRPQDQQWGAFRELWRPAFPKPL